MEVLIFDDLVPSQFISAGIGAVIGFLLALISQIATIVWKWSWRPILEIEQICPSHRILSHSVMDDQHEMLREVEFGFRVRNKGRTIAPNVRFQLLDVQTRKSSENHFHPVLDGARELFIYTAANAKRGGLEATIIPGASVTVHLAGWREDYAAIMPATEVQQDYYLETCGDAVEYRFAIVAFASNIKHVCEVLTIADPNRGDTR